MPFKVPTTATIFPSEEMAGLKKKSTGMSISFSILPLGTDMMNSLSRPSDLATKAMLFPSGAHTRLDFIERIDSNFSEREPVSIFFSILPVMAFIR